MADPSRKKTFRDMSRVFFRRRGLFFLSASLFAIAMLVGAMYLPIKYTAAAKFERRVDETLPEEGMGGVTGREPFETIKMTLLQELGGREAVEAAAEQLGVFRQIESDPNYSPETIDILKRRRIEEIRRNVDIRWDVQHKRVDLVTVTYTDSSQNLAQDLPNTLVDRYINRSSAETRTNLSASRDFLRKKVGEFDTRLKGLTEKKIALETKNIGLLEGVQMDIVRRQQQSKADLDAVRRLRDIAKQKYARLLALKQEQEPTSQPVQIIKGPNPELARLGAELREYKVELDLAMTLQHMTESHPAIQTLVKRIEIMEDRIRNTPPEIVLQVVYGRGTGADTYAAQVAAAQSEVEILEAEFDRVESQIAGYEKMMETYEPARQEYARVLEDLSNVKAETESWQNRLRQVEMALAAEESDHGTSLQVVELAKFPYLPSFPKLSHVLAVAFAGGLMFACVLLYLLGRKDRTIGTTEDATEYFDVPVAGVVGEILTRPQRIWRGVNRFVVSPILAAALLALMVLFTGINVLRLQYPEKFEFWQRSPKQFVQQVALPYLAGRNTLQNGR